MTEVQRMQKEGMAEPDIVSNLKAQGISSKDITNALTQSKIKEAVGGAPAQSPKDQAPAPSEQMSQEMPKADVMPSPPDDLAQAAQYPADPYQQPYATSMQASETQQAAQAEPQPQQAQAQQQAYPEYPGQQQYAPQAEMSTDTLTEISEQVVAEKLSPLRKELEKVIDMKTTIESKMEYIDERLKRIEKIIDRLQLSILQKVGDYATNIEDIKKEMIETQKSFKALLPANRSSQAQSSQIQSQKTERADKPKKLPSQASQFQQE